MRPPPLLRPTSTAFLYFIRMLFTFADIRSLVMFWTQSALGKSISVASVSAFGYLSMNNSRILSYLALIPSQWRPSKPQVAAYTLIHSRSNSISPSFQEKLSSFALLPVGEPPSCSRYLYHR